MKRNIRKLKSLCRPLVVYWSTVLNLNTELYQRCRIELYLSSLLFLVTSGFQAEDCTTMAASFCAD